MPAFMPTSILAFLNRIGEVMGSLVLVLLYFALLGPLAIATRLFADPLRLRPPRGSSFLRWEGGNGTLRSARRQG